MNIARSARRCSIYFGLFSITVAILISLAQQSANPSILVGVSVVVGFIYTDWLGWFSLHRFLVYILMITGAAIAVGQFLGDLAGNRLLAVGNLLIYVQLPLIFQKKSKRVFEQWGVFLLLELVVAALVNNNVLYGIMMLPILGLGCAAMLSLAHYSSLLRHNESQSESIGWLSSILHWIGRDGAASKAKSGIALAAIEETSPKPSEWRPSFLFGWRYCVLPIALSVLLFSIGYFYTLPRLNVGAYQSENWMSASVGFSEQVSLRYQGEIRQNETPVFRMQMTEESTGREYRPNNPPYIRMTVLHRYMDGPARGIWQKGESAVILDPRHFRTVPSSGEIRDSLQESSDRVIVSVVEKSNFGEPVAAIPPFAYAPQPPGLYLVRRDWRLVDTTDESRAKSFKRRYSFRTYAFRKGEERSLLPETYDTVEEDENTITFNPGRLVKREELTEFPSSLSVILPLRDELLSKTAIEPTDRLSKAFFFEQYLSTNPDFSYSLRITPPVNSRLDPIADFLLNKRKGHCEYFASAFAMLLRSMNIPTRIVIGFRPSDYNELGGYFQVQQKHAHVWVEAFFSKEELRERTFPEPIPDWVTKGMWLRFDPTPAGDGSNARGSFRVPSGQTFSVMQDLWSEMILNMDKTRQSRMLSIFAETSEESYDEFLERAMSFFARLRSSRLIGDLMSPEKWFSWRAAAIISTIGVGFIFLHRAMLWLFPHWTPKISLRRIKSKRTNIDFYDRITRSLKKLGMERVSSQTPREFLEKSKAALGEKGIAFDGPAIANAFYDVRYGGCPLTLEQKKQIETAAMLLEQTKNRRMI